MSMSMCLSMAMSMVNAPAAPVSTRSEIVNHVIDLADLAYPQEAVVSSTGGERGAYEVLVTFLRDCRVEDLVAIQALAYCGARYYSTYEEALEAAHQDLDEHSYHCLASKRFLADWLRAGLACG